MKLWKWVTVLLFPPSFPLPFLLNLFSNIRATRDLLPHSWHRCLPPPVWSLRATQLLSCLLPLLPPPTQALRLSHHLRCTEHPHSYCPHYASLHCFSQPQVQNHRGHMVSCFVPGHHPHKLYAKEKIKLFLIVLFFSTHSTGRVKESDTVREGWRLAKGFSVLCSLVKHGAALKPLMSIKHSIVCY